MKIPQIAPIFKKRQSIPPALMDGRPIPESDLRLCFEAANLAPSHRRTDPWRFTIFMDEKRNALATAMVSAYKAWAGNEVNPKKAEKLSQQPLLAGAVFSIEMHPPQPPRNPEYEEILAMGCAMQNFHLCAAELGLGGYWTTPKFVDHELFRTFLELPAFARCFGLFYLGTYVETPPSHERSDGWEKVRIY